MYIQAPAAPPPPGGGVQVRDAGSTATHVGAFVQTVAEADRHEDSHAVRRAVAAINRTAKVLTNTVQLVIDERSERPIVKVMDTETGQLIRQIPSEEVLELRRALERASGLLINGTA